MSRWRRPAAVLLLLGAVLVPATAASAHPLGNFTVNTYSGLRIAPEHISVEFIVDMAEIPTLQRIREIDADPDAYASRECEQAEGNLSLLVDDRAATLRLESTELTTPPGQAGLRTLRLVCRLDASTGHLDAGGARLSFTNANFTDRVGWREVTAVGDGTTLVTADVPTRSVSRRLTSYPKDLLASPLDQRSATLVVKPGGAAAVGDDSSVARSSPLPRGVDRATRAFTSFVGRHDVTLGFAALALLASLVLGAIHALAPGHGKTVMAAYLVGQRGSLRQAMVIALTVTATHTAGVLALGIAISASAVVAPERLYPWLGAASGALLAAIGVGFLARIVRLRRHAASHDHDHHHHHDHGDHHHHHHHHHGPVGSGELVTWRGLVAMGFVGGLLPSPSAVVVLLGAIALGRVWFGVLLVTVYGLGMAATLAGAGVLLVRARGAFDRLLGSARRNPLLLASSRLVPSATGVFITAVGLYLAVRGAVQI